jgi:hypothetical protein
LNGLDFEAFEGKKPNDRPVLHRESQPANAVLKFCYRSRVERELMEVVGEISGHMQAPSTACDRNQAKNEKAGLFFGIFPLDIV